MPKESTSNRSASQYQRFHRLSQIPPQHRNRRGSQHRGVAASRLYGRKRNHWLGDQCDTACADGQLDGLATDWQQGVNDGSLLEMRVIGSQILVNMMNQNPNALSINFGYVLAMTKAFATLPSNGNEGAYELLSDATFLANAQQKLHDLGIENVGEQLGSSTHYVLAAEFYRPPYEFDMANPTDTNSWRKLSLAVDVSGVVTIEKL